MIILGWVVSLSSRNHGSCNLGFRNLRSCNFGSRNLCFCDPTELIREESISIGLFV